MPYGLYLSAEGAQAQSRRLEVLANNLANVNTVGFKPDVPTFQARFAEAIQQGQSYAGSQGRDDLGGGVKVIETRTNFAAGRLERTGQDADLAIIGNGFFEVAGADGQKLLTRAGAFRLDATGRLVTADGSRTVLDTGGAPVTLNPELPWSISAQGFVQQEGTSTPLSLVEPPSLDALQKAGANMFTSPEPPAQVPLALREVRQGYLEMSGANPTSQMMDLIETSRAFEANARMIQTQDTAMSGLINRVLRV